MDKVFVDYVGPLPCTRLGNKYILVVVDAFSRFCWLVPTPGVTTPVSVRHLSNIFAIFGPPRTLVSDNAPAFTSRLFKRFCFERAVRHVTTTPYYPQPSFAERVNRNLKAALIAFHGKSQTKWDLSLSWLNLTFNTARHESHGTTPASLILGYSINSPLANLWSIGDLLPDKVTPQTIQANWSRARQNIRRAHDRLAHRYNQGRRPFQVNVGDKVFIQNHDIRSKLAPRFLGPCQVVQVLGPVSLKVKNLRSGKVSRVHASQVKVEKE